MPKEFIKQKVGNRFLIEARRQQKQLSYFTQSIIQEDLSQEYINAWANRNYKGDDDFLNWVKNIFRTENFLSFFKYFRNPVASARLVNDKIKPQLSRVFFSEDAFFKYIIDGDEVPEPEEIDSKKFNDLIFDALLFRHNDILIADLSDINTPFRDLISIDNVVAIESKNSIIRRIAYSASFTILKEDGTHEHIMGFIFMDNQEYILYDERVEFVASIPHDLGICPADYISREAFGKDDIVRKSIFSYVREQFEEYVFLKTLLKMQEPNGALPIITKLKTKTKSTSEQDTKGPGDGVPFVEGLISSQVAEFGREVQGQDGSPMQAGTVISVDKIKKDDGSIDMDLVKNFINFFFIPVESLKYIDDRIKEIENSIVSTVLGDLADQTGERKNEQQIRAGFVGAEDRLRGVSLQLSRIRTRSDHKILALKFGPDRVFNEAFYGSDFFLESKGQLYELFKISPNPIERRNLLIRMTKNDTKFNPEKGDRQVILYKLMPYVADDDFKTAIDSAQVAPITFQLQTRFNHWIGLFEAQFGDILVFWNNIEGTNSEKLILINNLLIEIIKADPEVSELLTKAAEPITTE